MNPHKNSKNNGGCKLILIISIVFALILAILTVLGIVLFRNPQTTRLIRDFMIIILTIEAIIIGITIIIASIQITKYIRLIQEDIRPIMEQTSETITTIQETVHLIQSNAIKPLAKVFGNYKKFTSLLSIFIPKKK